MPDAPAPLPADRALERVVGALDRSLGLVLAGLMFAMMLLTFVDVVGRQGFDTPVSGGNELTEIAMGFVVYLGLPLVCLRREHITIGLLSGLFRGRARKVQHVTVNLLLGVLTFIWARQVWIQGEALADSNELLMFLQVSVAPYVYAMSALTFFAAALFLLLAWYHARGLSPKAVEGTD